MYMNTIQMNTGSDLHYATGNVLNGLQSLIHPNAREVTSVAQRPMIIRAWLERRFHALGLQQGDQVELSVNKWNEAPHNLGLQSVNVVVRGDDRGLSAYMAQKIKIVDGVVLLADERKSPTIGIIAPGMIDPSMPVQYVHARFPITNGEAEEVEGVTYGLHFSSSIEPAVNGLPAVLHPENKLCIKGGHAVTTLVQAPSDSEFPKVDSLMQFQGIYACRFITDPQQ